MATTVSAMLIVLTAAATKPQSPLRLAQSEPNYRSDIGEGVE